MSLTLNILLSLTVVGVIIGLVFAMKTTLAQRIKPVFYLLFCGLGILGYGFISLNSAEIEEAFAKRSWPKAAGEIIAAELSEPPAFRPLITYSYQVGDSVYQAVTDLGTPPFGGKNKRKSTAERIVDLYPVGKNVGVFYSPENPAESTIRVSAKFNKFVILSIGSLLYLVAIWGATLWGFSRFYQ